MFFFYNRKDATGKRIEEDIIRDIQIYMLDKIYYLLTFSGSKLSRIKYLKKLDNYLIIRLDCINM